MELAVTIFNVGAGLGLLAVGIAVAWLAWRVTPLVAETRELTRDLRRLTRAVEGELRPMLDRAEETVRAAEVLTDDAAVKVARLRDAVDALDEIARSAIPPRDHLAGPGSVEFSHAPEEPSNS